jgi:hypothetical protein
MARIIPRDGNAEIRAIGWRVKGVSGRMSRPAGFSSFLDFNLIDGAYFIVIVNSQNEKVVKKLLINN